MVSRCRIQRGRLLSPLLLLLLAGMGLANLSCRPKPETLGPEVARVQGRSLAAEKFAHELEFALRTSGEIQPRDEAGWLLFGRAILDDLIDRELVMAAARESGMVVAPAAVERELLKLKGDYGGSALGQAADEAGVTPGELRTRTAERMLVERYFTEKVFSRVAVSDREIATEYAAHEAKAPRPPEVHAYQILLETREAAKRVRGLLRGGLAFSDAARSYSRSPDAQFGGDLGFFAKGSMPEPFDRVCFSLPPGSVSDIVASAYGFHLFKVTERRAGVLLPLAKVKAEIEARLLRAHYAEAQQQRMAEWRSQARIQIDEAELAKAVRLVSSRARPEVAPKEEVVIE